MRKNQRERERKREREREISDYDRESDHNRNETMEARAYNLTRSWKIRTKVNSDQDPQ